jgi:acetyltransferase-like isoleucine patch superfamily enzyme
MTTRIENTAIIQEGVILGNHCYVGHFTFIRPRVIIGDHTEIRAHVVVAADAKIGSYTNINQFTNICRDTIIEDYVFVGPGVIMTNTKKIAFRRDYDDISQAPYIEYGAMIGGGTTICPGVRIGRNSSIGAGSLVTKDTEPEYLYYGNPARKIRKLSPEEILAWTSD